MSAIYYLLSTVQIIEKVLKYKSMVNLAKGTTNKKYDINHQSHLF